MFYSSSTGVCHNVKIVFPKSEKKSLYIRNSKSLIFDHRTVIDFRNGSHARANTTIAVNDYHSVNYTFVTAPPKRLLTELFSPTLLTYI